MEDKLNVRRPKWKTTSMEDDQMIGISKICPISIKLYFITELFLTFVITWLSIFVGLEFIQSIASPESYAI